MNVEYGEKIKYDTCQKGGPGQKNEKKTVFSASVRSEKGYVRLKNNIFFFFFHFRFLAFLSTFA